MSDAARLAHDVGKYVARIARNVAEGAPVPAALLPLLIKDLYELPGGGRASARFETLALDMRDPRIDRARSCLSAIDALEPALRAGDEKAAAQACALAREVEALLRDVARSKP